MDLREALRSIPATREFTDEPIDELTLRSILDDARFAPSGGNRQGWRVVVLDDAVLDKYTFVRDANLQRRRSLVYDGNPPDVK